MKHMIFHLLFFNSMLQAMENTLARPTHAGQCSKSDASSDASEVTFYIDIAKKLRSRILSPASLWETALQKLFNLNQVGDVFESSKLTVDVKDYVVALYKQKNAVDFLTIFSKFYKPIHTNMPTPRFCIICPLERYLIVQQHTKMCIYDLDNHCSVIFETEGKFCSVTDDSVYVLFIVAEHSFLLELQTRKKIIIKECFNPSDDILILHENLSSTCIKNMVKYIQEPTIDGKHPHAKEIEAFEAMKLNPNDYLFGGVSYVASKHKHDFNRPWFHPLDLKGIDVDAIPRPFMTGPNSLITKVLKGYITARGFTPWCGAITRDGCYVVLAGVDSEAAGGDITRDGRLFKNLIVRVDLSKIGTPEELRVFTYESVAHIQAVEISPDGNLALILLNANIEQMYQYLAHPIKQHDPAEDENRFVSLKTSDEKKAFKIKHFSNTKILLFDLITGLHTVLLEKELVIFMHFYKQGNGFCIWDGSDCFYDYNFSKFLSSIKFKCLTDILKMAKKKQSAKSLDEQDLQKLKGLTDVINDKHMAEALNTYFVIR